MSLQMISLRKLARRAIQGSNDETDVIYRLLYEMVHDLDGSLDFAVRQTERAFSTQWSNLPSGQALLSDTWFRDNVDMILSREEIQVAPEWFKGKWILDAGCGNGRWAYGFAKLGANIVAVDVNESAVHAAKEALRKFEVEKHFRVSRLEDLGRDLPRREYDLVFCWGVLHHCGNFSKALSSLTELVGRQGMLYLYLYGRKSLNYEQDMLLFKKRILFNTLPDDDSRYEFLLREAHNNVSKVHNLHDLYAPLINRRFQFDYIRELLKTKGFGDVTRTIEDTELFVRAIKSGSEEFYRIWALPKKGPPYWFHRYR